MVYYLSSGIGSAIGGGVWTNTRVFARRIPDFCLMFCYAVFPAKSTRTWATALLQLQLTPTQLASSHDMLRVQLHVSLSRLHKTKLSG